MMLISHRAHWRQLTATAHHELALHVKVAYTPPELKGASRVDSVRVKGVRAKLLETFRQKVHKARERMRRGERASVAQGIVDAAKDAAVMNGVACEPIS